MLNLPSNEVHLWYLRPSDVSNPARLAGYLELLSELERARHDRFVFEHSKREYLLTRALVRTTLSRYADKRPEAWSFLESPHGQPLLDDPLLPELRFNLTNTYGLIALVLARGREVGVDTEWIDRSGQTLEIASHFFSGLEVAELESQPEERQRERFFDYWTLKEAYIKARGLGLAIPLDQFSLIMPKAPGQSIQLELDPRLGDDPQRWRFDQLDLAPRYKTSLAIEAKREEPLELVITRVARM